MIGAAILSPNAIVSAYGVVAPGDFHHPAHATIWAAILDLHDTPAPVDVVSLAARLESTGRLRDVGGREQLRALEAAAPLTGNAAHHARVVAEYARCRRAIAYADRLADVAYAGESDALTDTLAQAAELDGTTPMLVEPPPEASALIAEDHPPDWVIAHLLARLEVVLIVAEPGAGKTTLLRQIAACVASGLHPFTRERITPRRAISFDFQDPPGPAIRATRDVLACAGDSYRKTWWVELRQQGIDLTNPRDQAWFEAKVASVDADLVIAGPLYNMLRGAPSRSKQSEETAEIAGRFLMDMLVRRRCALILEAHAPHGEEMRVRGSKYWEDWASFGHGLVQDDSVVDRRNLRVVRFRGDRETDRQWPTRYIEGSGRWFWDGIGMPDIPPDVEWDHLDEAF